MTLSSPSPDIDLTSGEELKQTVRVWAFDARYLWFFVPIVLVIYFSPLYLIWKVIFIIPVIWIGSYTVRQRWRLTLTNKRMTARQLYPRPFTFMSKSFHFPYNHIEGLSIGPKTNITFFLFGLAVLNIGINMLKVSLSTGPVDLPDTLEFIIFLLKTSQLFSTDGDAIQNTVTEYYIKYTGRLFFLIGIALFILGIGSILVSYPWRKLLVVRIRYGADFKLKASIGKKFISEFYSRLYITETIPGPKKFRKWNYTWLKDEFVENVADLDQTLYGAIIIGTFAFFTGSYRVWRAIHVSSILSRNFIFWLFVALLDLAIIILSIKYSKRTNEMIITNKRIIFAQEVYHVSGVFGKRYYFISDLRRKDISGFEFRKSHTIALEYLIVSLFLFLLAVVMARNAIFVIAIVVYFIAVFFLLLVNQTFVGFALQTKSGDKWVMRHYLASPFSRLRSFIGDETSIFSVLLSNRLEEREIINTVQILRAREFDLQPKLFEKKIKKELVRLRKFRLRKRNKNGVEKISENDAPVIESATNLPKSARLSLDDLLLIDEKIEWRKDIAYPLRSKKLSLIIGSIVYFLFASLMFTAAVIYQFDLGENILSYGGFNTPLALSGFMIMGIVYGLLLLKYYSFRRLSIIITKRRIFYESVRLPPKWLFVLGFFRDVFIRETLIDQLQTLKMKRNVIHKLRANNFTREFKNGLFWLLMLVLIIYIRLELIYRYYKNDNVMLYHIITVLTFAIIYVSLHVGWDFSSAAVELVQAWPTIIMDAEGIKLNFPLPYLNLHQAQATQFLIWSGTSSRSRLKYLSQRKRIHKSKATGDEEIV